MRCALACLLTLATGILPTLGTPHAHSGELEPTPTQAVTAVQHAHGIGLDHHHAAPDAPHEDAGDRRSTQNLDGDRLVMFERAGASAAPSLRQAVGYGFWTRADTVPQDRPPACPDRLSGGTGPPVSLGAQLEVHVCAPRRGPPLPSV